MQPNRNGGLPIRPMLSLSRIHSMLFALYIKALWASTGRPLAPKLVACIYLWYNIVQESQNSQSRWSIYIYILYTHYIYLALHVQFFRDVHCMLFPRHFNRIRVSMFAAFSHARLDGIEPNVLAALGSPIAATTQAPPTESNECTKNISTSICRMCLRIGQFSIVFFTERPAKMNKYRLKQINCICHSQSKVINLIEKKRKRRKKKYQK